MVKRIVDTDFWTSRQVIDSYSVEDKYFALYLMTNGRSTQVGIYSLPKKVMSFETGYTTDVIQVLINRFSEKYGEIIYSEETQEVTLLNSLSYSILTGGKPVQDLLQRELRAVEDGTLILETYHAMQDFWNTSIRKFDQTIKSTFEQELTIRNLIDLPNDNQNVSQNTKQKHNTNHMNNHHKNHNHNQDSLDATRKEIQESIRQTSRKTDGIDEEERVAIERYIKYLAYKKPNLNQEIEFNDVVSIFYNELVGEMTVDVEEKLKSWELKLPKSIILEALIRSADKFKPISYAETVILNWLEKGVESIKDIAKLDRAYSREQLKEDGLS